MNIQNMTVNADALMAVLSTSLIDPWWEHYWILKCQLINFDKQNLFSMEMKFYFLSLPTFQKKNKSKKLKSYVKIYL